jgi:CubicO group peptidase (beta-lactamase class C family)
MRKIFKRTVLILVSVLLVAVTVYTCTYVPVVTGFSAKTMCSGIFVSGRNAVDIERNDLNSFPCFHVPKYVINYKDSSVTVTFWGMASKTAVYRKGLGATLINNISAAGLRKQVIETAGIPNDRNDSLPWPQGNRIGITGKEIDTSKLSKAVSWAFYNKEDTVSPTRAVVVIYNDQLIYERYSNGFTASTKQNGWSMAKSITNAMVGILVRGKRINMNAPAPVKEWEQDERRKITPANLMQLNSGLRWWGFEAAASTQTNMLFKEDDMAGYALNQSLQAQPGKVFNYSDGSVNILQLIMRRILGDHQYYRFPYEQLFYKLGMFNTVIEADASGTFTGSTHVYATARDWARLGSLYLHDGMWNGQRILPEGWVKFSTKQSGAANKHKGGRYGAGWWVNEPDINSGGKRLYEKVPEDCFYAQGYDGQYVWVIPSKKMVVVRLAREAFTQFIPDNFLADLIAALPK